MPFPNYQGKHDEPAIFTAAEDAEIQDAYPDETPEAVVLTYHEPFFEQLVDTRDGDMVGGLDPHADLYVLDEPGQNVGVVGHLGIGAPATAYVMERLVEYGVEEFVALEYSGCLQHDVDRDEVLVCERAIRDEGTSHHYRPTARYATASDRLVEAIVEAVDDAGLPYRVGDSWTTDAFFRETGPEVRRYAEEGVLTVDMEASATFTVADVRGADAAAVFVAADYLGPDEWEPTAYPGDEYLERIFDALLEVLA